jgi:hypothetical protein
MQLPDKLFYYSKSKDVPAGYGVNEFVSDKKSYTQLNEISNWRKILSNFHVAKFKYEDYSYSTVEHCYHAQKFSLVSKKMAFKFTIESDHAFGKGDGLAARKRRKLLILTKEQLEEWEKIKYKTTKAICLAKYNQVPIYKKVIDLTNKAELWHIVMRSTPVRTAYLEEIRDSLD